VLAVQWHSGSTRKLRDTRQHELAFVTGQTGHRGHTEGNSHRVSPSVPPFSGAVSWVTKVRSFGASSARSALRLFTMTSDSASWPPADALLEELGAVVAGA
jgi:hypothetical protein